MPGYLSRSKKGTTIKNKPIICLSQRLIIASCQAYQRYISPCLPPSCRFYPSCSEYTKESVKRFGVIKGLYLACRRLLKCHPLHRGGYDPVPEQQHIFSWDKSS